MESRPIHDPNLIKYLLRKPLPNFGLASEGDECNYSPLTCKAKGLPICEPENKGPAEEEEIVRFINVPLQKKAQLFECPKTETEELDKEEISEELESSTLDEDLLTDDIDNEVERIKFRVSQLDRLLGLNTPECPEVDSCLDMDLELKKDFTNPDILQLQRNNRKLQQQIGQLELARNASDASMNKLKEMMSNERAAAFQLQNKLNELDSFKRIVEREQALCAQRYRYLEKEKYDGNHMHPYFKKIKINLDTVLSKFVKKTDYQSRKIDEVKKIRSLHQRCKKLHDYMFQSFEKFDTNMGIDARLHSPELATFLYRNEKVFGVKRHSEAKL